MELNPNKITVDVHSKIPQSAHSTVANSGTSMNFTKFESSVFFATVRIASSGTSGNSIGTGFLLRASFNGSLDGQGATLLISNKHVFADPSNVIRLQFLKRRSISDNTPVFGEIVSAKIADLRSDVIYVEHPDQAVDLGCLVANAIEDLKSGIFALTIPRHMLATFQEPDLIAGMDIYFVGYPANRYDTINNLPLMRHGYIASLPTTDFQGKPQFIVDAQVWPGSSGSPVFANFGGKMRLMGVVAETMIEYQEVKQIAVATVPVVKNVLGLGIVLKSTLLPALIDAALDRVKQKIIKQ